jgi:hypothetical protein
MPFKKQKGWGLWKPPFGADVNLGHPLAKNLTAFYLFNEGGGTLINDNVAGINNGAIQKLGASTNTQWLPTPYGIGLKHDATAANNGIKLNTAITSGTTFTFEVLFNWTLGSGSTYGNLLSHSASNGFWFKGNGGGGGGVTLTLSADHLNTTTLSANKWYHYVCSVNAGTATFYINGKADGSVGSVTSLSLDGMLCDNNGTSGGEQFIGSVAYERFWIGRALTANEVQQLYLNPFDMVVPQRRRIISGAGGGSIASNI